MVVVTINNSLHLSAVTSVKTDPVTDPILHPEKQSSFVQTTTQTWCLTRSKDETLWLYVFAEHWIPELLSTHGAREDCSKRRRHSVSVRLLPRSRIVASCVRSF